MKRWRSRPYLKYVAEKGCMVCRRPAVAHHWRKGTDGGIGLKPSDFYVIPLCYICHDELHRFGVKSWMWKRWLIKDVVWTIMAENYWEWLKIIDSNLK